MDIVDPMKVSNNNPWGDRGQIGTFNAVWQTIKRVITKPDDFFGQYHSDESMTDAFLFYVIVSMAALVVSSAVMGVLTHGFALNAVGFIVQIIATPILVFITAGVMHPFVLLLGGKGGFRGTFHVIAYAGGAVAVFSIVPVLGAFIAGCLSLILTIMGYKRVHELTTGKAVCAYLVPFILGIGLMIFMAGLVVSHGMFKPS